MTIGFAFASFLSAVGVLGTVGFAALYVLTLLPIEGCRQLSFRKSTTASGDKIAVVSTLTCWRGGRTEISLAKDLRAFLTKPSPPFFVANGKPNLSALWFKDGRLEVRFGGPAKVVKSESLVDDVEVVYVRDL